MLADFFNWSKTHNTVNPLKQQNVYTYTSYQVHWLKENILHFNSPIQLNCTQFKTFLSTISEKNAYQMKRFLKKFEVYPSKCFHFINQPKSKNPLFCINTYPYIIEI